MASIPAAIRCLGKLANFLSLITLAHAYPSMMPCDRALEPGVIIMGAPAVLVHDLTMVVLCE